MDLGGVVLNLLIQQRRNQEAAETFLRRVVDECEHQPRVAITAKVASYPPCDLCCRAWRIGAIRA